jgi:hypothetical protein
MGLRWRLGWKVAVWVVAWVANGVSLYRLSASFARAVRTYLWLLVYCYLTRD